MPRSTRGKGRKIAKPAKAEEFGPEDASYGVPGRALPEDVESGQGSVPPDEQPEQAGGPVTGAENIERQQKDPDLKDTSGSHP
jgi:hypothetical protein